MVQSVQGPENDVDERLQIGELARRLGLNPRTIRYYEGVGLLPEPRRSEAGYRLYGEEDERRLRFISSARRVGFPLGEIKEILALRDGGKAPCRYVSEAIERRQRELDRQLADLRRLRAELAALSVRARSLGSQSPPTEGYCHILESRSTA